MSPLATTAGRRPATRRSVQRRFREAEVACPQYAAERARDARDAQSDAVDRLGCMLDETDAPLAQRARTDRRHHLDLRDGLDGKGAIGRAAGLEPGELLQITHELRLLSRLRAPGGT